MEAVEIPGPGLAPLDARRQRAHRRAQRHSAQVRFLRVAIPLGAAAAVLAVAAVAWLDPFGALGVTVSLGEVSVSGSKVTMESPRLTGYRGKDGRPYEVTAKAALQDVRRPTVIELQSMKGRMQADETGTQSHLEAAAGVFDTQKESLELSRSIRLWTDKGQEARLTSAQVNFKAGTLNSREPVTVTLPNGTIRSDGLEVVDNGRSISFVGNVKTVFDGGVTGTGDAPVRTSAAEVKDDQP
ncbi:LPS export ABC transporter periplasmic protein LptC [Methylobacterium sp. ID0610]|uniref:LPS export ABC transporter periplasmic protein LptC n=1 Tax=Methylobacterium carpenticola TaxID=3344827 RepID=UPI003680FE71